MKKSVCIVVPTIRQAHILSFLEQWRPHFKGCQIIVVEDNPQKTFDLPNWVTHFSWEDIETDLQKDSWIISRRSPAIRSYGFLKALEKGAEVIITLDDDCLPEEGFRGNFVNHILKNLQKDWDDDRWWSTLDHKTIFPRGYPYSIRQKNQPTMVHHGLWSNIPDLDGITQKNNPKFRTKPARNVIKVPFKKYFPLSSMNLAFKKDSAVLLYMLLMGQDKSGKKWGYERFDDIWAGIFTKKIADHLGYAISSGFPSVQHERASNVEENIQKEKPGLVENEWLWEYIEELVLTKKTLSECYLEVANHLRKKGGYWKRLAIAMHLWVGYIDYYEQKKKPARLDA